MMDIERREAALRAVEAVEAAGGTAYYFSLDLRDGDAVSNLVDDIRQRYGKIDVLLHAGGLLIDKRSAQQGAAPVRPGLRRQGRRLLQPGQGGQGHAHRRDGGFSSVAGRFGNNGQSDYSSANDLLCKISSSMRTWRPETRGIAIDWTAWGRSAWPRAARCRRSWRR